RRFTYAAEDPGYGTFVEGTWWEKDYRGPPLVSISLDVAQAFDMRVGDTLSISSRTAPPTRYIFIGLCCHKSVK
ncbi:MAG: hypothetical protein OQK93_07495, partial [Gammaproteobacteria bacterium]|nr:hypothetical protein [Gammaproteobacteria bacterium]